MSLRCLVFALIAAIAPVGLSAQRLDPPLTSATLTHTTRLSTTRFFQSTSRNYRFEGTVVGALLLGAAGAWVGNQACRNQPEPAGPGARDCARDTLSFGVVGGALGAGLGYLVGRTVPRRLGAP